MQVLVNLDGRGVITVLPERSVPIFPLIIFLRRSPCDELHALRDSIPAAILHQQVDVIGCHHVVEHAQTEAFLRFENPMQVTAAVTRKL